MLFFLQFLQVQLITAIVLNAKQQQMFLGYRTASGIIDGTHILMIMHLENTYYLGL